MSLFGTLKSHAHVARAKAISLKNVQSFIIIPIMISSSNDFFIHQANPVLGSPVKKEGPSMRFSIQTSSKTNADFY